MIPGLPIGAAMEAASSAAQGLASIASGIVGSRARRREQRQAQREYDRNLQQFMQQDTSNLYANMQNPYEDLTVNTQAAEFSRQQQQQASANIMQGLQGAAGGSGIAALAQSLAQQETQAAQAASASIAQQEQANQAMAAQGAMSIQMQERAGAGQARALEGQKRETLLGMSQERLGAANEARQQATQAIIGGVGNLMGAGMDSAALGDGSATQTVGDVFGGKKLAQSEANLQRANNTRVNQGQALAKIGENLGFGATPGVTPFRR